MAGETEAAINSNVAELTGMTRNLAQVLGRESDGAAEAAEALARELALEIQSRISIVGPPPSEPGEAPHIDTGELYDSFDPEVAVEVTRSDSLGGGGYEATVGTDVEYAPYLEYGTYKMAARPYFRPAVESVTAAAPGIISDHLGDSASAAGSSSGTSSISAELPFTPA